jgi:hypothetical protein
MEIFRSLIRSGKAYVWVRKKWRSLLWKEETEEEASKNGGERRSFAEVPESECKGLTYY